MIYSMRTNGVLNVGQAPDFRLILEPNPILLELITERDRQAFQAIQQLELVPGFSDVIAGMHGKIEELRLQSVGKGSPPTHEERAFLILGLLDIRAGELLKLVSNLRAQNAFINTVQQLRRVAWQEYVGLAGPSELVQPEGIESSATEKAIFDRGQYWVTEGYKRLANAGIEQPAPENIGREIPADEAMKDSSDRRARVNSFLIQCNQEPDLPRAIERTHIWRAARHTRSRQFEYWQSNHEKTSKQNEVDFSRLVNMDPPDFVRLLRKMKLI